MFDYNYLEEKQKYGHKKAPDRPDQFITEMALSGAFYIEFNYFASCCKLRQLIQITSKG